MAEYQVNSSENELDKLLKQPRQYKTDAMIYRLTKNDSYRLLNNTPPMTMLEYENLRLALYLYVNERERSIIQTKKLTSFIKANYKESQYSEDFHYKIPFTLLSYFYNIPYSKIPEQKNLDINSKDKNFYRVISYEELLAINSMKERIVEKCMEEKFPTEKSALLYAQRLAEDTRADFIEKYGIDPLLIEKGQYNSDDVLIAFRYTEQLIKEQKEKTANKNETKTVEAEQSN